MIETTQTFYDNSVYKYRSVDTQVEVDIFDSTAKTDLDDISVNNYKYFYKSQLYDDKKYDIRYATLEEDEFLLDGSLTLLPNTLTNEQIGWWTPISDDDGEWSTNPEIVITFDNYHSTAGVTCFFDTFSYPLKAKCEWFSGSLLLDSLEQEFDSEIQCFEKGVNNFNKIVITFEKGKPNAFCKLSTIDYGVAKVYKGDELESMDIKEQTSLISNTISPNEFSCSIFNYDYYYNVFDSTSLFKYLKAGQQIIVKSGVEKREIGEYEYIPMGTFYISETSVNDGMLTIKAYGILNILNSQTFYSPYYTNATVETIVDDILDGYDYYINPNVKDITLSGYIPHCSKKEALKYVAIACNAVIKEGRDGIIYIFQPTEELSTNQIVTEDTIYNGYGLSGLMSTNVNPMPYINEAKPYVFTADRNTRISSISTSLIGVYTRCEVVYKTYTLGDSETLFEDSVTTDEQGQAIIDYNCAVSITSATGGGTFTHYADCSILSGTADTTYSVTIIGKKYEEKENKASSYSSQIEAYDDAKLTMTLDSCNELITSQNRAKSISSWILSQLQKRKEVEFDWWSVATVEASDYIKLETSDGTIVTMQIEEIDYDLTDLVAKVKGVM